MKYRRFFVWTITTSVMVYLPVLLEVHTHRQFVLWLLSILVLWLIGFLNRYVFALLATLTSLMGAVEWHLFVHWGDTNITDRLEMAFRSPQPERFEYLKHFLDYNDFFILSYLILVGWLIFRVLMLNFSISKYLRMIAAIALSLLVLFLFMQIDPFKRMVPYKLTTTIKSLQNRFALIEERERFLQKRKPHDYSNKTLIYDKIVLVIGESVRRDYMSLYGYEKKTTPFFDSLAKKPGFCKLTHVISPANLTSNAIPMELTAATVDDFNAFKHSESILTVMKDAGYETFWLSNQYKSGKHDTTTLSIAKEAEYVFIANGYRKLGMPSHKDKILLEQLKKISLQKGKKEIFIFHLLGSHQYYANRYDPGNSLIKNPQNDYDHYANSIYYTDFILEKIFSRFMNQKTLFVYFSDHAEFLRKAQSGHATPFGTKDEYLIPIIFYSTIPNERLSSFCAFYAEKLFNAECIYNALLYIIGLQDDIPKNCSHTRVITINSNNILDFNNLKYFKKIVEKGASR